MAHGLRFSGVLALLAATLGGAAAAQPAPPVASGVSAPSRLAGDWRSSPLVAFSAKPPLPGDAADLGAAPAAARVERVLLLLQSSAAQSQALDAEIQNQQDPKSAEYHHWLTPAQFADAYANSSADVAAIVSWLQAGGFAVAPLPEGRGWIEFSGTVAQLEQAFHTRVHSLSARSGVRLALADSISIPAALRLTEWWPSLPLQFRSRSRGPSPISRRRPRPCRRKP
jgi:hypothetical protein